MTIDKNLEYIILEIRRGENRRSQNRTRRGTDATDYPWHMCQVQDVRLSCQGIVPRLEAAEFVHRYSWFITRGNQHGDGSFGGWYLDPSDLFIEDSPQLSAVGSLYDML